MSFNPPLFKDFGKSLSDVLKKKFFYERKVTVKSSAGNMTTETVGTANKSGNFSGSVKSTLKDRELGTFEVEFDTNGTTKGSFETTKLADGLKVKLSGEADPKAQVSIEYRQEFFSGSTVVDVTSENTVVEATGVVGIDGVSVGGQVKYDAGSQSVKDFNAGFQYEQSDFTATVKTADMADTVQASYFHKVQADTSFGGLFEYRINSGSRIFTGAVVHDVNHDTTVKATLDSKSVLSTYMEQKIYNPMCLVAVSAQWNTKNCSTVPDKFGLGFTFGEI